MRVRLLRDAEFIKNAVLDLLAPPRCMMCLCEGDAYLCHECRKKLKWQFPQICLGCEREKESGRTCRMCRKKMALTGALSYGSYQWDWLRRGISWLKFKSVAEAAPALAELMLPLLPQIAPLPLLQSQAVLVPVPLHVRRERQRGFNQSRLLAEHMSKFTLIPCASLLRRKRATWAQAKLPAELRKQNIQQAFELVLPPAPPAKIAILVDDVTTTGSTLNAAAAVLKKAGFEEVWGVTLARG